MEQPARRAPAPPPLDRVQDLVNTVDGLDGTDETFTDPVTTAAWLHANGYTDEPIDLTEAQFFELIAVREAIRTMCRRNVDPDTDVAAAVAALDAAAERARLVIDFAGHGRLRAQARGIDAVVGTLLAVIQAAMLDATWRRLKACPNCGWVFHDGSRSRAGRWCTMTICGNRSKNLAHRQRHRDPKQPPALH